MSKVSHPKTQNPCDWRQVDLRPGALFVVGDSKQSIYRFRRADIDIYNEVRQRIGGPIGTNVVRPTTNFRAAAGLCDWANHVFAQQFPASPTPQAPAFGPLAPDPNRTGEKEFRAERGAFIFLPRGVAHAWDVASAEKATVLMMTVPAILEEFLAEFHAAEGKTGKSVVAEKYGIRFLPGAP